MNDSSTNPYASPERPQFMSHTLNGKSWSLNTDDFRYAAIVHTIIVINNNNGDMPDNHSLVIPTQDRKPEIRRAMAFFYVFAAIGKRYYQNRLKAHIQDVSHLPSELITICDPHTIDHIKLRGKDGALLFINEEKKVIRLEALDYRYLIRMKDINSLESQKTSMYKTIKIAWEVGPHPISISLIRSHNASLKKIVNNIQALMDEQDSDTAAH